MYSRLNRLFMIALAGFLWISTSGFSPLVNAEQGGAKSSNPFYENRKAAETGEELFGRNCQQCHNSRGKGGKAPQLVRGSWGPGGANSDTYMYQIITSGVPGKIMGGFGSSLSQEEIWQIVTFLRAEGKRVKAVPASDSDDEQIW